MLLAEMENNIAYSLRTLWLQYHPHNRGERLLTGRTMRTSQHKTSSVICLSSVPFKSAERQQSGKITEEYKYRENIWGKARGALYLRGKKEYLVIRYPGIARSS
jgi:hypothetical protein